MSTVVVSSGSKGRRPWNSSLCDCCAPPGGFGTCLYVYCCPFCAAGEVASKVGGSYCVSCCLPILFPPTLCCILGGDRVNVINKYNIADSTDCCNACCVMWFCPCCGLVQELNHIQHENMKSGESNIVIVQAPQPQMMAPAPLIINNNNNNNNSSSSSTNNAMNMMGGYPQQPMGGGYPQQPMGGGYPQQHMGGGYPQQHMGGGYPQQPMGGGYPQQHMGGGYPQQPMGGGYPQQPMDGGYPQQHMGGGYPQQQAAM